jgi:hypothetical protein
MSAATEHQPSDARDHRSGHLGEPQARPGRTARSGTYGGGIVVNVVMLVLINAWPGWEAVPFLTDRAPEVLGIVNASLVVAIVVNVLLSAADPPRFKALTDLAITGVGIAAIVQIWQVFPFEVLGTTWETVIRVLLVVALVGSGIAILSGLVRLVLGGRNRP